MAENEIPQRPAEGKPFEKPDEEDFSFGYLSSEARSAYQSVLDQLREEFSGTTPTDEEINERIADYLSYLSPQITAALTPFEVKMRVDLQKVLQKESDKGKTEDLVEPSETEPEELEKWLKKKKQTILNELINFDKKNRKETLSDEEKKQIRSEFFNIINPVLAEIDEIRNRHQDDSQLQAFIQDIDSIKTAFFRKWPVEKSEEESPNPSSKDENVAEPRAEEQKDPQNPNEPENSKDSGNPEGPENAEEWVEKQRKLFENVVLKLNAQLSLEFTGRKEDLSKDEKSAIRRDAISTISPFYGEAVKMLSMFPENKLLKKWVENIINEKELFFKNWGLDKEQESKDSEIIAKLVYEYRFELKIRTDSDGNISKKDFDDVLVRLFQEMRKEGVSEQNLEKYFNDVLNELKTEYSGKIQDEDSKSSKNLEGEVNQKAEQIQRDDIDKLKSRLIDLEKRISVLRKSIESGSSLRTIKAFATEIDSFSVELNRFKSDLEKEYFEIVSIGTSDFDKFFEETEKRLNKLLADVEQWKHFSESEKQELWVAKFDSLWSDINKFPDKRSTAEELREKIAEMRSLAEQHLSKKERDILEKTLIIRDLVFTNTSKDGLKRHLCWQDVKKAREDTATWISAKSLRDFMNGQFKEIDMGECTNFMENEIFGAHPENNEIIRKLSIEMVQKWNDEHPDQKKVSYKGHNYAQLGNPADDIEDYTPNIHQILQSAFPDLKQMPDFLLDGLVWSSLPSEMRMNGFYKFYDAYIASLVDGEPIEALAPWAAVAIIDYRAGGYSYVSSMLGLLAAIRYPGIDENDSQNRVDRESGNMSDNYDEANFASIPEGKFFPFDVENKLFLETTNIFRQNFGEVKDYWWLNEGMKILDYGLEKDDEGNFKKNTREGQALSNRAKLILVRNFMRLKLAPASSYDWLELNRDLKILPSPYDIVKGEYRGERIELSFSDLYAIYDTFGMYLDRIGAGPKKDFEDSQALFDDLSEVVGMIAKFKQMTKISENSVVLVDFLKLTNVLLTIYMIKLFKNFLRLPEEKVYTAYESEVDVLTKKTIVNAFVGKAEEKLKLAPKRSLFLKRAIDVILGSTTLPSSVRFYFVGELQKNPNMAKTNPGLEKGILLSAKEDGIQRWGALFNPSTENYEKFTLRLRRFLDISYPGISAMVEKWLNPPKEEAK